MDYFIFGMVSGVVVSFLLVQIIEHFRPQLPKTNWTADTEAMKNELAKASSKRESVAETIPPSDPSKPAMPAEWLALAEDVFRRNETENAATIAGTNPFKQAAPEAIKSRDMRNLGYTLSAYRYNGRLPGPKDTPTP